MNRWELLEGLSSVNASIWEKVTEFKGIKDINENVADTITKEAKDVGAIKIKLSQLLDFVKADKALLDDQVKQTLANIESRIAVIQEKIAKVPLLLTAIINARSVNPFSDSGKTNKYISARSSVETISNTITEARWNIQSVLVA